MFKMFKMSRVQSLRPLQSISSRRTLATTSPRLNNPPPSIEPSSFKQGMSQYKAFASPFAKVFLGAIFTYQVIYWTWLKLEMDESKVDKNQEVAALEKEARELTNTTTSK